MQYSFTDARNHFAKVLQELEQNQQPIEITRHGSPCAVLMPVHTAQDPNDFAHQLNTWLDQYQRIFNDNIHPFDNLRSSEQGREFLW